jgi:chorismate mutase
VLSSSQKIIIAGPCALESRAQLARCVAQLKGVGVTIIRACLWKPRTMPGWEGIGFCGLPMLLEETIPLGMMPATEILTAFHAQICVDALKRYGNEGKMLVWIGARNQNHFEIRRMAQILASGPPSLLLMFKNQVWLDKKHWFGIYQHILQGNFPRERLLACHRGFHPGYESNPQQLRNIPEYELSMEMKEAMQIPLLIDPSHIAGSRDKVFPIVQESLAYDFDGYMIEMHDDIAVAKTDADQQVTCEQLKQILQIIAPCIEVNLKLKL